MPSTSFGFLLIASALAVVLFVLRWLQGLISSIAVRRVIHRSLLPLLELAAVAAAMLGFLGFLAEDVSLQKLLPVAAIVIGLGWAGRRVLDDFVNGIILRVEGTVDLGRQLRIGDADGTVRRIGYRAVVLETDAGTLVHVPFSRIARESVATVPTAVGQHAHTFPLEVPRDRSPGQMLADVPAAALLSPWSSITRAPGVEMHGETEKSYLLEVTIYALDPAYVSDIEATVRQGLSKGSLGRYSS